MESTEPVPALIRRPPAIALLTAKLAAVIFGVVVALGAASDACLAAEGAMSTSQLWSLQLTRLVSAAIAYVATVGTLWLSVALRWRRGVLRAKLVSAPIPSPLQP